MNSGREKNIQLQSVLLTSGLGDIVMGVLGFLSLREVHPGVCLPGFTKIFYRTAAVELVKALLPDFEVDTLDHSKHAPLPRYSIGPKMRFSTLWKSCLGKRWTVDPAYAERNFNFGRKKPPAFDRFLAELQYRFYGIHDSAQKRFPSYKGHEMWIPLALRLGIGLRDLEKASYAALPKAAAALNTWLGQEDRSELYDLLIFPSAMAFQFIPPDLCIWLRQQLPHRKISICLPQNDPLIADYEEAGFPVIQTPDIPAALRLMQKSRVVVTPDSLTGHLAPLLALHHLHLFSHELPRANLHPAVSSIPIYDFLSCSPCQYAHRNQNQVCVAGYRSCKLYESPRFREQLVRALH